MVDVLSTITVYPTHYHKNHLTLRSEKFFGAQFALLNYLLVYKEATNVDVWIPHIFFVEEIDYSLV
jgi:hypothetical protein